MQLSQHSAKQLIVGLALTVAAVAGAAAPNAQASNADPITVHHFTGNGAPALNQAAARGSGIRISTFTVLPQINPQPLPPRKGPPCLPCPMVQQG